MTDLECANPDCIAAIMRPTERIEEILDTIWEIWKLDPDMRFLQLVYFLQSQYSQANDGLGKIESEESDGFKNVGFDLFDTEDGAFHDFLKTHLQQRKDQRDNRLQNDQEL